MNEIFSDFILTAAYFFLNLGMTSEIKYYLTTIFNNFF